MMTQEKLHTAGPKFWNMMTQSFVLDDAKEQFCEEVPNSELSKEETVLFFLRGIDAALRVTAIPHGFSVFC